MTCSTSSVSFVQINHTGEDLENLISTTDPEDKLGGLKAFTIKADMQSSLQMTPTHTPITLLEGVYGQLMKEFARRVDLSLTGCHLRTAFTMMEAAMTSHAQMGHVLGWTNGAI